MPICWTSIIFNFHSYDPIQSYIHSSFTICICWGSFSCCIFIVSPLSRRNLEKSRAVSMGRRAENRTQACFPASQRNTNKATPHPIQATLHPNWATQQQHPTVTELRHTLTELFLTLNELCRILTKIRRILTELRRTLTELRRTPTELRRFLIFVPLTK
jgi:hypothetical protein